MGNHSTIGEQPTPNLQEADRSRAILQNPDSRAFAVREMKRQTTEASLHNHGAPARLRLLMDKRGPHKD